MKKAMLVLLFVCMSLAFAKSYYLSNVDVNVNINQDGSFGVREDITFDFTGCFSWAYRNIPRVNPQGGEISVENLAVSGEGIQSQSVYRDGNDLVIKWYYSACDTQKTYSITYLVKNQIILYSDVADFYWKFHGDQWDVRADRVTATVHFPQPISNYSVWWYGIANVISRNETSVVFGAENVPSETFVEGRVVLPSEVITGQNAVWNDEEGLPKILKEIEESKSQGSNETIILILAMALPILTMLLILYLWFMYGREPHVEFDAKYLMEPPSDDPPAIVGALMNPEGKPSHNDIFATIIDLAVRGYVTIEERKEKGFLGLEAKNLYFRRTKKKTSDLKDFEKMVLNIFFTGGVSTNDLETAPEVSSDDVEKTFEGEGVGFFKVWSEEVAKAIKECQYHDEKPAKMVGILPIVTFVVIILAVVAMFASNMEDEGFGLLAVSLIVSLVLFAISIPSLYRRTPKGALEYKKWMAFKNMLSDYSQLKHLPATGYILWDRYFVYATTLGVANQVAKFIDTTPEVRRRYRPVWYSGAGYPSFMSLNHSFSTFSTAARPSGGGGFGGGGGGGSGGGGGGAG